MDHKEERHLEHRKEREHEKREKALHEEAVDRKPNVINIWFLLAGCILLGAVLAVWFFAFT
jgi:hypothetical protein